MEVMRLSSIWQKASRYNSFVHPQKLMELALHWQHSQELHGVLDIAVSQELESPWPSLLLAVHLRASGDGAPPAAPPELVGSN